MHGRACAYCQCGLLREDRGDVEHFRPKSRYSWLAYNFDNFLLACRVCNIERKGNEFPLTEEGRRSRYDSRTSLDLEPRLLIDPAFDPVEEWIHTSLAKKRRPVELRTRTMVEPAIAARVEFTIKLFGLNHDYSLWRQRIVAVDDAINLLARVRAGEEGPERLSRKAVRSAPHGITVRNVLEELAPDLLPTEEFELLCLVGDLVSDLLEIEAMMQDGDDILSFRVKGWLQKRARELCWALAVIWYDPPAETPDRISSWLEAAGVLDQVDTYLVALRSAERQGGPSTHRAT